MIDTQLQRKILSNCSFYQQGARYSNLKSKSWQIENDLFNYHLQHLVKKGYLIKRNSRYFLSTKGKSIVTNIDNETKDIVLNYKVSTYIVSLVNKKVLLYRRLKHPQYGYTGFISGKLKYGEKILDAAKRECKEETHLNADFKLIGNLRQIRKNEKNKVIEDGIFYVCYTNKVTGTLLEKGMEGKYFWASLDKITTIQKLFKPSVEIVIEEIVKRIGGIKTWGDKFIYEFEPPVEKY